MSIPRFIFATTKLDAGEPIQCWQRSDGSPLPDTCVTDLAQLLATAKADGARAERNRSQRVMTWMCVALAVSATINFIQLAWRS